MLLYVDPLIPCAGEINLNSRDRLRDARKRNAKNRSLLGEVR